MPRIRTVQTNFSSGEIDPAMELRSDVGAYANGAKRLRNVMLTNTGGVRLRPGTEVYAPLAGKARIKAFTFDEDEEYVFAFTNGLVQIFRAAPFTDVTTLAGPWTTATMFQLTFASLGDKLIIMHPTFQPRVVTRTGLTAFAISTFSFSRNLGDNRRAQPHFKFVDDAVTLKPDAVSGTIDIEASAPLFVAGHVGTRFRIYGGEVEITAVVDPLLATAVVKTRIRETLDPDPFRTRRGSKTVIVTHVDHGLVTGDSISLSGANDTGGIPGAEFSGTFTIEVLSSNAYQIDVPSTAATSSVDGGGVNVRFIPDNIPTRDWTEQAWSSVRGWPSCGVFHANRFWMGGSTDLPSALFASVVGRYTAFDLGEANDTDGIGVQIGQDRIVTIRHMVSDKHLQIFTDGGEYYVPQQEGVAVTPLNITARKQTPFGILSVAPVVMDNGTLYVQKSGTAVREFVYDEQSRSYQSNSLTITASHLLSAPKDMAVMHGTETRPEQYTFVINGDGTCAVFHSARVERLAGWTLWTTQNGSFVSVDVVDGAAWFCIERHGGYWLERLDPTGVLTVDFATRLSAIGVPTKVWTLNSRYALKTLDVCCSDDGAGPVVYAFDPVVATIGGVITLPSPVGEIQAGYGVIPEIETLPPVFEDQSGSLIGEKKRIAKAKVGLRGTMNVEVNGTKMLLRRVTDDLSQPPAAHDGYYEFTILGYHEEPTVTFTQSHPMPLEVLGIILKVSA